MPCGYRSRLMGRTLFGPSYGPIFQGPPQTNIRYKVGQHFYCCPNDPSFDEGTTVGKSEGHCHIQV
jgi:hypothetical protein